MYSLKNIITLLFICFSSTFFAQEKLNQYGYIIIPNKLEFQKEPNQYNINNMLKNYLDKHDFTVFMQGDPKVKNINPCNILKLNANKSGFFKTKILITFADCYGNNIYTSIEGTSKIKEFKPAYYDAFKKALKDPNIQNHKFETKSVIPVSE